MPPLLASKQYPYTVVGVLEIFYEEGGALRKWVGSGYLLKTAMYPHRRDIVLTAAHNLVFLRKQDLREVHFTLYGDRDVYSVALRKNGTLRYAIPRGYDERPHSPAFDFAVMILQEGAGGSNAPLALSTVGDTLRVAATIAGGLSARVGEGNRKVYCSTVTAEKQTTTPLYYPVDATAPGMSGGPVLVQEGSAWTSIGVVTGTGDVDDAPRGIAAPIFDETRRIIDTLIQTSLAG
ncbi:trypsin-like serine peptidase [Pyxidicoccus sp. MSG2]|uniref:trypsin-like serine peptidase n=1 Tax=Pyxidicoccus sp. MSG2 TaxID=2996790 RepID=UPI002270ECA8|nr:hypothetical protein [Pyxidicoccus sp. MSG2]MCY1014537.1 hypothetical protein [Pyxidicoccus sp. MSG2]